MLAPQYPGMTQAVAICLTTMMVLDFLVMYFIDKVMRIPGLMVVLTVLGSVLIFVQRVSPSRSFSPLSRI